MAVSDDGDPQQLAMIGVNPITALLLLRLFGPLSEGDWIAQTGANFPVASTSSASPSAPDSHAQRGAQPGGREAGRRPRAAIVS